MADSFTPSSVLALTFTKCVHMNEKRLMTSLPHTMLCGDIFHRYHEKTKGSATIWGREVGQSNSFEIGPGLCVGDVINFNVKSLEYHCQCDELEEQLKQNIVDSSQQATRKASNAFQVLMAGGRQFVKKKERSSGMKEGLNQKDELFNRLVDEFRESRADFPKSQVNTDGPYIVQVLCNALWHITNHHDRINSESRRKTVVGIPKVFDQYQNFNDTRKKKIKQENLSADQLESHSQALYSLLLKPVTQSTPAWKEVYNNIKDLADCLSSYKAYLCNKAKEMTSNHELEHPVRTVGENTTVEHRQPRREVKEKYLNLDAELKSKEEGSFVFFEENQHIKASFESALQRFRFLEELQLSVPIDIYKFSPGGSVTSTVCIVKSKLQRSEKEILVDGAKFVMTNIKMFQEFHTRSMKRSFKNKINNIAHVSPMILNFIYKELTLDATTAEHPDTQERLRLISLGETDLIADLRHCNAGRPSEKFDTFFQHLALLVEESTAADERRQGTSHLSEWISLSDMIEKARQRCPEMTLIPSKSLVRLQFAPRNPYAKSAWNFTSKIDVQYKIQRRQLRMSHPDQHYCNALFKYLKEMAIELKEKGVNIGLFCCDDKAKVPIGEPGFSVSTGVRGKQTIAPTSTTLVAADHDMTKSSLTPSVILECDIPDTVEKSFVKGQVSVTVNDSVFQTSNPFRHAASLSKLLAGRNLEVLLKYTDGGVDHRNTLESVKCACICLFKEHNLDLLVAGRCAPGHSWRNPAERVMSILNLGLQNCALERVSLDDDEKMLKRCGSMKEIREMAAMKPELNLKKLYKHSIEPVQALISNRFRRFKLKEKPIVACDPLPDEEIDTLKRHLRELFPQMDLGKLQKIHTNKVPAYIAWKEAHCQERQYTFQIRKCDNPACCIRNPENPNSARPKWLPDPVLRDTDHYMSYNEVKDLEIADKPTSTVDSEQSTVAPTAKKSGSTPKRKKQPNTAFTSEKVVEGGFSFSAQTARSSITCVECRKPRVVYSQLRLSGRQELQLAELMSEYIYTCGSPLTPPGHSLHGKAVVRMNLACTHPVEVPFYSASLGRLDLCYYCGGSDGEVDQELKKQYKTVLPVCRECLEHEQPPCYRPYGKKKANSK